MFCVLPIHRRFHAAESLELVVGKTSILLLVNYHDLLKVFAAAKEWQVDGGRSNGDESEGRMLGRRNDTRWRAISWCWVRSTAESGTERCVQYVAVPKSITADCWLLGDLEVATAMWYYYEWNGKGKGKGCRLTGDGNYVLLDKAWPNNYIRVFRYSRPHRTLSDSIPQSVGT